MAGFAFPTALIHLSCFELLPLWILNASWYTSYLVFLEHDLGSTCAPTENKTMLSEVNLCFTRAAKRYLISGQLDAECRYSLVGYKLGQNAALDNLHSNMCNLSYKYHLNFLGFWALPILSICLAAYVYVTWVRLVMDKPQAIYFESGAYIRWSWILENHWIYKVLVLLIAMSPISLAGLQLLYFFEAQSKMEPSKAALVSNNALSIMVNSGLNIAATVHLAFPKSPCHENWSDKFDDVDFQRHYFALFSESNDWFGQVLVEAMWEHAVVHKSEELSDLLLSTDPDDMLDIAQMSEVKQRRCPRLQQERAQQLHPPAEAPLLG